MKRASVLYYVAGALALIAALVMMLDGLVPEERFRASVYIVWAAIMFALGYGRRQKST